jgi:hypothetical protein
VLEQQRAQEIDVEHLFQVGTFQDRAPAP